MDIVQAASSSQSSDMDWLKLEGSVKLRIMTEVEPYLSVWDDKEKKGYRLPDDIALPNNLPSYVRDSRKYICYVVVHETSGPVLMKAEFGPSIINQIAKFHNDEDYRFDRFPTYDLKITKEGTGKNTRYTVLPTAKSVELPVEITDQVLTLDPKVLVDAITTKGFEQWKDIVGNLELDAMSE